MKLRARKNSTERSAGFTSDQVPSREGILQSSAQAKEDCSRGGFARRQFRRASAFTFAEVLAAMLFVALVLPAAVYGIRMAGDAGTVSERKITAVQLGESKLSELAATDEWRRGQNYGTFPEPWDTYSWKLTNEGWNEAGITELRIEVTYTVRQRQQVIYLTTLVPEEEESEAVQ